MSEQQIIETELKPLYAKCAELRNQYEAAIEAGDKKLAASYNRKWRAMDKVINPIYAKLWLLSHPNLK